MDALNNKYIINIYERYLDLKNSNKLEFDNNDLWKIFEYYSCLKLSEEYKKPFYEYDDIDPTFKEINKMSRNDTGIDLSDLDKIIVQCKLRKNTLTWKECSTFFGSQNIFNKELNKAFIRWENLIITRNNDCTLSENLLERKDLFIDRPYIKQELIEFCENLIITPPKYPVINNGFKLRDYQQESINLINQNKKNVIINLPTGTGKNSVIIYSFQENKKYLILVPRIILMEQLKEEIIKHTKLKTKIQLIGDTHNEFNENKNITICVFNSVSIVESHCNTFEKIYIDEAHHINKPEIYWDDDIEQIIDEKYDECDEYTEENSDDEGDEYTEEKSEDEQDDTEDELKNVKSYTQIIKSLVKYNNNVYLSATIDKVDGFEYYSKDIRDMINLNYLCDYTVHIPIFSEDPDNKKICEHLLKNYRNIIIYCNSQKEGKEINKLMNKLQNNSSEYIDCKTPKKKRNDIINKYKDGKIPFLVNVRILVEGFDAPITKGVCFLHLPNNKTTLIQIIGRCLRLHPTKTIANIILPFSSKEDETNVCNFLKVISKNDSRIKKSFENKNLGGYISIDITEETENEEINNDIEFKYNMIYNSIGILQNGQEIWLIRLEELKKYIDLNKKKPSIHDKNKEIKQLGRWISNQQQNYKIKKQIMSDEKIYNEWTQFLEKYKEYFISREEIWFKRLEDLKNYIDLNKKKPSESNKNKEIKQLGRWISKQQNNYKTKKEIMSDEKIYNEWTQFLEKYKEYFISREEIWFKRLEDLKNYIDLNKKKPSESNKNKEIKQLGRWISDQQKKYKTKKEIMSDEKIYNEWTEFLEKYKEYFISNEELWLNTLEELKKYIDLNKKRPSSIDKNKEIKQLGSWISNQQTNYKTKKQIMSDEKIHNEWTQFLEKYKEYFISNEELWLNTLEELKKYIDLNKKKPVKSNKNKEIKQLGIWISHQQNNYKTKKQIMSDTNIYNTWIHFITSEKYKKYFYHQ